MRVLVLWFTLAASACAGTVDVSAACTNGSESHSISSPGTVNCGGIGPFDWSFATVSGHTAEAHGWSDTGAIVWAQAGYTADVVVTVLGGTGPVTIAPCLSTSANPWFLAESGVSLGGIGMAGWGQYRGDCISGLAFTYGEPQTLRLSMFASAWTTRWYSDAYASFDGLVAVDPAGHWSPVNYTMSRADVPEPGTWWLIGAAGVLMARCRRDILRYAQSHSQAYLVGRPGGVS